MTCGQRLDQLVNNFENQFPCRDHWAANTRAGWQAQKQFTSDAHYPFHSHPERIPSGLRRPDHVRNFLRWLNVDLRNLGYINLFPSVIENAAANPVAFQEAVSVAVDGSRAEFSRIDDTAWGRIPGFGKTGGDRVVAKKIIATYFPDKVMPIFKTAHLEHFVDWFGLDRNVLARQSYSTSYSSLTVGKKWQLLCTALLSSKAHYTALAERDNAYFMGVLYAGPARPPDMSPNPCRLHPGVVVNTSPATVQAVLESSTGGEPTDDTYEIETGIKRGQPYHNSKAARKAIELRAMELAKEYYAAREYSVDDTSRNHPYDLRCTRRGEELRVEVKGKTDDGSTVVLTRNEVKNTRNFPRVALFIVSHIKITESDGRPVASGGQSREWNPWNVDDGQLDCLQYEYSPLG